MWSQQQGSSRKASSSEPMSKSTEENFSQPSECKTDSSLYDSGRTDSGFLSGANLVSETIVSEEISSTTSKLDLDERHSRSYSRLDSGLGKSHSTSYSRLDSGVDVGLSDQLSELCIDETDVKTENILTSRVDVEAVSDPSDHSTRKTSNKDKVITPWEYYFKHDEDGDTQLHIAIIQGFIEVVFHLIQLVPKPSLLDIRNDMRQTALHLAVLTGQAKVVRRLVCAGADTRQVDHDGNTPLHLAVASGDLPSVRALTQPVSPKELHEAKLRYSAPVIQPPHPDMYNYEGLTCVHIAILGGHIGILMYLVKEVQANINAREYKRGMSCLHMACEAGNESLAMVLLELNASHRVENYAGDTPYGVARAHTGILRLLLEHGASPEVFTDSEPDDDDEDEFQMYSFRDLHINGIVNATA